MLKQSMTHVKEQLIIDLNFDVYESFWAYASKKIKNQN